MANVFGGTKDPNRGKWCTEARWAGYVGAFDLDPFTNPRSHIEAAVHCMLERNDNGFGLELGGKRTPGEYVARYTSRPELRPLGKGELARRHDVIAVAGENTRVWFQPPYEIVDEALDHYGHTRFVALLRWDPPCRWFQRLYKLSELVCSPRDKRMSHESPSGVKGGAPPLPHVLFYRRAEDATRDVLRRCNSWRPR
jgi:hypothetical protein